MSEQNIATTAEDYRNRYHFAFEHEGLTQGSFHSERDGRKLACALGVLGDEVYSSACCPASVMPRWLAQMVPEFFDRQKQEDAFAWGLAFTDQLKRIDGKVPFAAIHDWHANTVCPLGIEVAEKRGGDPAPHKALQELHLRALAGEKISADDWRPVLRDAYADADAYAYAYAYAYADADAYAYAYADAYAYAWKRLADGMVAALSRVEAA